MSHLSGHLQLAPCRLLPLLTHLETTHLTTASQKLYSGVPSPFHLLLFAPRAVVSPCPHSAAFLLAISIFKVLLTLACLLNHAGCALGPRWNQGPRPLRMNVLSQEGLRASCWLLYVLSLVWWLLAVVAKHHFQPCGQGRPWGSEVHSCLGIQQCFRSTTCLRTCFNPSNVMLRLFIS